MGVLALAEALVKSTQTILTGLGLRDVGMGDGGISALATLVSQGRMEHLTWLDISENEDLTQQGIIALARAIDARGLPRLERLAIQELEHMTARGISAITLAVIKGCPQLKHIFMTDLDSESDLEVLDEVIHGMLAATGRAEEVKVYYNVIEY